MLKRKWRRSSLMLGVLACCWVLADATSIDQRVELELADITSLVTGLGRREFRDEAALYDALIESLPPEQSKHAPSVPERIMGINFERRFYLGPPSREDSKAQVRMLAITSTGRWGRAVAFCADTTPQVCVRRDGFEPRVKLGKCEDARCEVFARDEQVQQADRLFRSR